MTSCDSVEMFRPKSKHAVHRLLQLAQNRIVAQEHWQASINPQNHTDSKGKSKIQFRYKRLRQNADARYKNNQKERLKQLADRTINQQDLTKPPQQNKQEAEIKHEQLDLTLKFIRNAKLRPFNSNMTVYSLHKQMRPKFTNSSLSFYKTKSKVDGRSFGEAKNQSFFPPQGIKKYEETGLFQKQQTSKSVIYFSQNKSETVRKLLNRMSVERTRSNHILLNSTERCLKQQEKNYQESEYQENYISQQQLKLMNRYSKFFPFQKDEQLLYSKISEAESIWLNKFKESWQRSKQNRGSRGVYLKKLIVK